jgi:hypothetical protein
MNEDRAIRRSNLQSLRLTPSQLSERCGRRYTYWRDLLEDPNKSFGEKVARAIEAQLSLPRGWLDEAHDHHAPTEKARLELAEPTAPYAASKTPDSLSAAFGLLGAHIAQASVEEREAIATNLAGWARQGGGDHWVRSLAALLQSLSSKQPRTGTK